MHRIVAVDTETTGLQIWQGDMPFALAMHWDNDKKYYFEWPVDPYTREVKPKPEDLAAIKKVMENPDIVKVFHNAKFDMRALEVAYGIHTIGEVHDTLFMAHVANNVEPSLKLKYLADKYCGIDKSDERELKRAVTACRRKAKSLGWKIGKEVEEDYWLPRKLAASVASSLEEARCMAGLCGIYCLKDVERTMMLWCMYREILKDNGTMHVYERELNLYPRVYRMETRGVMVRGEENQAEIERWTKEMHSAKCKMFSMAGREFNPKSPKQMGDVLYNVLKARPVYKTSKGQYATSIRQLREFVDKKVDPVTEFCQTVLTYRAANNGLVNFFEKYEGLCVPDPITDYQTLVLHPSFNQIGPKTGRFSCRAPNFQNVANANVIKGNVPVQARVALGPRPGYVWFHYDYSQLEARVFAEVSGDETMLQSILHGYDVHDAVANKTWGGRGNPEAVRSAINALELYRKEPTTELVAEAQKKYHAADHESTAIKFLEEFDWSITAAEASIGKKHCRNCTKLMFYTTIYGGGYKAVMRAIDCDERMAKRIQKDYYAALPTVKPYIERLSNQAKIHGYITNIYGRRLSVIDGKEYAAVNYMVQGSSADMLKLAMIKCDDFLLSTGLDAHMVMTIHDELVFEVRKDHAYAWMLRELKRLMEDTTDVLRIPIVADIKKVTERWSVKTSVHI